MKICSGCKFIPLFCDYAIPKPDTTMIKVRYSAVMVSMVFIIAAFSNGTGNPITLRLDIDT